MSATPAPVVLPRPGTTTEGPVQIIPAPTEESFTSTFGALLPPAEYLTTPNGKAAYYSLPPEQHHANSPRVLFLHGVQTPVLGMLPLAQALQSAFPSTHCVLFDHWGHGLSCTPLLPHEPSLFHALIDSLLDHLGWSSAHLVGFSFGGATVAGYVARSPQRVSSFSLVAPAGLLRSSAFTEVQRGYLTGATDEVAAGKWVIEFLEGGQLVVPGDWRERVQRGEVVAEALREWQMRVHEGHPASVVGIFRDGGVMDRHETFAKAAGTGIPSIVVLGELDDLCTVEDLTEAGFKDVVVVPQVGHGVVRERVPEVEAAIGRFWSMLEKSDKF